MTKNKGQMHLTSFSHRLEISRPSIRNWSPMFIPKNIFLIRLAEKDAYDAWIERLWRKHD